MIKKIALLAFASIMAVSSVASAASTKKIKVSNESAVGFYYKVGGGKPLFIPGNSSKSFSVAKGKKSVSVQASTSRTGGFKNL